MTTREEIDLSRYRETVRTLFTLGAPVPGSLAAGEPAPGGILAELGIPPA